MRAKGPLPDSPVVIPPVPRPARACLAHERKYRILKTYGNSRKATSNKSETSVMTDTPGPHSPRAPRSFRWVWMQAMVSELLRVGQHVNMSAHQTNNSTFITCIQLVTVACTIHYLWPSFWSLFSHQSLQRVKLETALLQWSWTHS